MFKGRIQSNLIITEKVYLQHQKDRLIVCTSLQSRKMWISKRSISRRSRKPIRSPLRITIPLPQLYRNRRTGLPFANPQPDEEVLPGYIKPQAPVSKQSVPSADDAPGPGSVGGFANTGADAESQIADDPNDPDDDDDPNGEDQDG